MARIKHIIAIALGLLVPSISFAQTTIRNESQASIYSAEGKAGNYRSVDRYTNGYVNIQYSTPANYWSACSSSAVTDTSNKIVKNGAALTRIYVTSISCSNTQTIASTMIFHDGATTLYGGAISNSTLAGVGSFTATLPVPLRAGVGNNMQFSMGTTGTSTICCMSGYTAAN